MSRRIAVARRAVPSPPWRAHSCRRPGSASPVGARIADLAVGDRLAAGADLGERAVADAVPAGDLAAEHLGARPADSAAAVDAEQALAGRVEPDDPALRVDLEDAGRWRRRRWRRARGARARAPRAAGALRTRPRARGGRAGRSAARRRRAPAPARGQSDDRVARRLVAERPRRPGAVGRSARAAPSSSRSAHVAGDRRVGSPGVGDERRAGARRARRARAPRRRRRPAGRSSSTTAAAELAGGAAGRDQLAELVLGEQRVGLALGVVERAPAVALERVDAGLEQRRRRRSVAVGRRAAQPSPSARSSRTHDTAPGIEVAGRPRSPSRSARPRRATSGRVERMPRAAGRDRGRHAPRRRLAGMRPRARTRRPPAAACRGSSCRRRRSARAGRARRPRRRASPADQRRRRARRRRRPRRPPRGTPCRRAARTPRRPPPRADGRRPGAARPAACRQAARRAAPRPPGTRSTRLSPWSPSPRTASSRVRYAAWRSTTGPAASQRRADRGGIDRRASASGVRRRGGARCGRRESDRSSARQTRGGDRAIVRGAPESATFMRTS